MSEVAGAGSEKGVAAACQANAEERAFITGDGVGKPLGLLAETGGAKVGVKAAKQDAVTFDEIFKLYYALKAPYRKKAQFLCNEALVLQLMTIKDNNGNYYTAYGKNGHRYSKRNRGERAQVHLEDHHEGIVSREQFERVQTMIQMGLLHSGRKKYNDEQQKVLNDPKWQ